MTRACHVAAVAAAIAGLAPLGGTAAADDNDKRPIPDYDGRGNTDAHPSSALWIPRVVLAPFYAVHEMVVRRPLGMLVITAEKDQWVDRIANFLTFGPDRDIIVFPTVLYDFGVLPSVGATVRARDLIAAGNTLSVHAATWGPEWYSLVTGDRYTWDRGVTSLETRLELTRRQDNLFVGIGPDATSATKSRYGTQLLQATESITRKLSSDFTLALTGGLRHTAFRSGTCCGDPSLDQRIEDGEIMAPPGFDTTAMSAYGRIEGQFDTRSPRPAPGTGAYVEAHAEPHVDTTSETGWIRYGGEAGVAYDLDGRQRIVKLMTAAELVDPVGNGQIPFYELAQLGGYNTMAGFLPGWMNGRSTWTAGLAYTWPVWVWLDGQARLAVGNAFDEHFGGFAADKLRLSADVGLTSVEARGHSFELIVGVGTETFEQGGRITSVRVAIGSREGL